MPSNKIKGTIVRHKIFTYFELDFTKLGFYGYKIQPLHFENRLNHHQIKCQRTKIEIVALKNHQSCLIFR